jgi:hypothetical protein
MKPGLLPTLLLLALAAVRLHADRWGNVVYSDNKGVSLQDAIVITGAKDDFESTKAEYVYLRHHFPHFKLGRQSLLNNKSRDYDLLEFADTSGGNHNIYFDITEGMQKLDAELKTQEKTPPKSP